MGLKHKRLVAGMVLLLCVGAAIFAALPAFADNVQPISLTLQTVDGESLLVKTYNVPLDTGIDTLIDSQTQYNGTVYLYKDVQIEPHEGTMETKEVSKERHIVTDTTDLAQIVRNQPATLYYAQDDFVGTLYLDAALLEIEQDDVTEIVSTSMDFVQMSDNGGDVSAEDCTDDTPLYKVKTCYIGTVSKTTAGSMTVKVRYAPGQKDFWEQAQENLQTNAAACIDTWNAWQPYSGYVACGGAALLCLAALVLLVGRSRKHRAKRKKQSTIPTSTRKMKYRKALLSFPMLQQIRQMNFKSNPCIPRCFCETWNAEKPTP